MFAHVRRLFGFLLFHTGCLRSSNGYDRQLKQLIHKFRLEMIEISCLLLQ